jgi:hypothetical protein
LVFQTTAFPGSVPVLVAFNAWERGVACRSRILIDAVVAVYATTEKFKNIFQMYFCAFIYISVIILAYHWFLSLDRTVFETLLYDYMPLTAAGGVGIIPRWHGILPRWHGILPNDTAQFRQCGDKHSDSMHSLAFSAQLS